jgi:hypothetical protein
VELGPAPRGYWINLKEIEQLIGKLQLDKKILADPDGDDATNE